MLNVNMNYRKGVFFIRLYGELVNNTINEFEEKVFPILLMLKFKKVVINMDDLLLIDNYGIDSLLNLKNIVIKGKGKTSLCTITSSKVKDKLMESGLLNEFLILKNELMAIGG